MTVRFCPGALRRMGGTATRWFRKPILVRDNRFDSCILRRVERGDGTLNVPQTK